MQSDICFSIIFCSEHSSAELEYSCLVPSSKLADVSTCSCSFDPISLCKILHYYCTGPSVSSLLFYSSHNRGDLVALLYPSGIPGVSMGFSSPISLHSYTILFSFDMKICRTFWTPMPPRQAREESN